MKTKLKKVFRKSYLLSLIVSRGLYYYSKFLRVGKYKELKSNGYSNKTIKDMFFSKIHYQIDSNEYILYKFQYLNDKGRKQYMGDREKFDLTTAKYPTEIKEILDDKYKCYERFEDYYKRKMILVDINKDKNKFIDFCNQYKNIAIKPFNGKKGKGFRIINYQDNLKRIFEELQNEGNTLYVLEEVINQSEELSKFHANSINTIRVSTYYNKTKDDIKVLFAFIRFGVGESKTDNLSAGGISAVIDVDTGVISTPAMNKKEETFIFHPDTNEQILGYRIPRWKELMNTAKELSLSLKECQYISWDFALTDDGWEIVEANAAGGLNTVQMHGTGIRDYFLESIK